ncbi:MAG: alpha amylase C-terminal domain-containing protein [Phycisphaerales bacterium]|nr:alpha amylase C-terminal domain-containing protein [Phycisphaerales bacterium]
MLGSARPSLLRFALRVLALAALLAIPALAPAQPSSRPGMGAIPYAGGVTFRVWAPNASTVAVGGTFNAWSATANPLYLESGGAGNWSVDVPGAVEGQEYKFVLNTSSGQLWKNDPRARQLTSSVGNSIIRGDTFDWSVYGPTVTLFSDGFESGTFGPSWARSGTSTWRVQTSTTYKAAGTRGCTFDSTTSSSYQTSRLTLTTNASNHAKLSLTYKIRNVGDETHSQDGVYISNNGTTWYKVDSFPAIASSFSTRTVDISAAAAANGITPGTSFRIRWQEYDNSPLSADGVAIDDVALAGRVKSPGFTAPAWNEMVIYEMHIGTFNDAAGGSPGNFNSAIARLDQIQALGVNAVKVMPVAEFAGDFSWGYNPAHPFAVEGVYGGHAEYKRFINEAHARGLAVIQDVVHNHYGPSDLDLWRFDGWYQNNLGGIYFYNDYRSATPWGDTRPDYGRGEVRTYIRDHCLGLLQEYRVDGLRWDSTVNIRTTNNGVGTDIPDGWSLMQYVNNEINSAQAWKISIAEDLQNNEWLTKTTGAGGAGFDSQWDAQFVHPIRDAIITGSDASRNMFSVRDAITHYYNGDHVQRVIYTESHDEVANGKSRVPEEIWPGNAGSWASRKRSTLGAALVFTSPGIPMIFQGQEVLEDQYFQDTDPVDWTKLTTFAGIQTLYRDLVRLRRNWYDTTRGLRGNNLNIHHVNDTNKVIAFHRWQNGGAKDDCIIVANFANTSYASYNLGFPRAGTWRVRFNSDWNGYSSDFANTNSYDTTAVVGAKDGMANNGNIGIGPYTVIILSQDN